MENLEYYRILDRLFYVRNVINDLDSDARSKIVDKLLDMMPEGKGHEVCERAKKVFEEALEKKIFG